MSGNLSTPYIIQINEPIQTLQIAEEIKLEATPQQIPNINPINNSQVINQKQPVNNFLGDMQMIGQEQQCIMQILYPQDLNLSAAQYTIKRGRPKKKKPATDEVLFKQEPVTKTQPRTRSGRLIKLPKHMANSFKKIDTVTDERQLCVSDFHTFQEKDDKKLVFEPLQRKKRLISAQYKCPKCLKAYLGKNKMIDHLKKYPDHGPLPEGYQEFNFDVWNYLFDITQKCKSGQRGIKFCEELSNLLHNVQLLKSALFKTVTDNKNCVHIDRVLGNAIGLAPGKYKFDENELYKDVTVLKLITNCDFFKPSVANKQHKNGDDAQIEHTENKRSKLEPQKESFETKIRGNQTQHESVKQTEMYDFTQKTSSGSVICSPKVQNGVKKPELDAIALPADLLTEENLLLHSLPNSRNGVEELMLTGVDNGSNLLDNSTSSDEVMNVDQFVNERFKKIIEPDIEIGNPALNLDLPSLELFQFNTS